MCHAAPVCVARIIAISYRKAVKLPIRPNYRYEAGFGGMLKEFD